jgi:hypothetical protein
MVDEPAKESLRSGRYALIRVLGEGAQAATLEAVDKRDGRLVAIKRFRVRGARSWKEVELAEREAHVLASIAHPQIPRYVEHFEEGGELFLVTERIEGEDLLSLRKRGVRTSEAEVVRFLRDASSALDYLHGLSPPVVHRDIKPSNVMRRPDGSYALVDFGSVRDRMKPAGGSTVVGTFGYMAPEQFQGRAMPASDVYAAGATALSMLTGREPEELPHKGLAIDVKAAVGPGVSTALVSALSAMLEPDPDKRATRIAPLLSKIGSPAPAPKPTAPAPSPAAWGPPGQSDQRRSRPEERDGRREGKREGKRARKEAERAAKEAAKDAERAAKEAAKDAERAAKEAVRAARRGARGGYGPEPFRQGSRLALPGPILFLALMGLTAGQIAVTLALRVAIPLVFTLLSIVFGKSWREAARSVGQAGKVATESMERAKAVLSGRSDLPQSEGAATGVRVEVPEERPRVRVDPAAGSAGDRDERAEIEAEAAREAERRARGRRS